MQNSRSLIGLDETGAVILRRRLRREAVSGFVEAVTSCIVGMKVCWGAHHLGRLFATCGHEVRRMELERGEHKTSAESIYRHVYSSAGLRAGLPRQLALRKPKRGGRRRTVRRAPTIPNRTAIHQRPTKAHLRAQFGHWEGDLMHFQRQRNILLRLQERRSRLMFARRLLSRKADVAAETLVAELGALPARARRTIIQSIGGEFAQHKALTAAIGLRAFLCNPHSPCSAARFWNLNTPRKCLGYKAPLEGLALNFGVAPEV